MFSIKLRLLLGVLLMQIIALQDSYVVIAFPTQNDSAKKEQSEKGAFDIFYRTVNGAKLGCRGSYKDGQQQITDIYIEDNDGHRTIEKVEIKKLTPGEKRTRRSLLQSLSPFRHWPENCIQQIFGSMRYDPFNLFGMQGGAEITGSGSASGNSGFQTVGDTSTGTATGGGGYVGSIVGVGGGKVITSAGAGGKGVATVIANKEEGHLAASVGGTSGSSSHFGFTLPAIGNAEYGTNGGGSGGVAVDVTNTGANLNGNIGGNFDIGWRDCLLFGKCDLFVSKRI